MNGVTIARERFRGWEDTYRVGNGLVEARVVADVGPRIVEVRRAGGDNLFHLLDAEAGGRGEPVWRCRGGWRLWLAPERRTTTYALDNASCAVTRPDARSLRVVGAPQPESSVEKEVVITIDPDRPRLQIESRVRNIGARPVTYALWTLAVMRPGGRAFLPLDVGPPTAFDDVRRLILWSYASVRDPRYRFGDRLIEIDHAGVAGMPATLMTSDQSVPVREGAASRSIDESKIGVDSTAGWAAYLCDGTLFVTRANVDAGPRPDGGATAEVYSSREFVELEHLGVLTEIAPGGESVLREEWWVLADVAIPPFDSGEAGVRAALAPHLRLLDESVL